MIAISTKIKTELASFSLKERAFVLFSMLCSFLICAEYAIIRPVSNATFLSAYGSHGLPWVWLATLPLNFCLVALYNYYLPRWGCWRLFATLVGAVIIMNGCSAFLLSSLSCWPFVFYLWKEVYIMLMFQQLWSVIHMVISFQKAKYLYGLFFAVGAFGAFLGSLLPGFCAVTIGSESLLVATLPLYLLLALCYRKTLCCTPQGTGWRLKEEKSKGNNPLDSFAQGAKLVFSSRYLCLILGIVLLMQLCSTLVDFQFNAMLEKHIPLKDLRTEYTAKVLSGVHLVSIFAQMIGSFLCAHYLGVRRSHLFIPLFLGFHVLAFQCFPLFGIISLAYVSVKSCDFSLFIILKEMLYIPLTPDEKFRAKSIIDVFGHRSAKALGSFLILGCQAWLGANAFPAVGWGSLALFILWAGIVAWRLREPKKEFDIKPVSS